jgi:ATP-binding cassette subfamily G (WHITE) protein 2 (SNQ2)
MTRILTADRVIPCVNNNLIPNFLPQYENTASQACSGVRGAAPMANFVNGDDYLSSLSYSHSHLWRNVGIILAYWALYVGVTIFFTLRWDNASGAGITMVVPRECQDQVTFQHTDEESQSEKAPRQLSSSGDSTPANSAVATRTPSVDGDSTEKPAQKSTGANLVRNTSVFTWRNLTYTVKTPDGDRVLLDKIEGYVKPGMVSLHFSTLHRN